MGSRSASPEPAALPDTVLVGRVRRAHGVRGVVRVEIHSDTEGRFARGASLLLRRPGSEALESVRVASFHPLDDDALVRFDGYDDRDCATTLRGAWVEVERAQVPAPEPGTYYCFELVGCACVDAEAGPLGTVVDVIEDGGGLLLRLADPRRELLVPFVETFLVAVDVAARRIDLRLPPGLVETCAVPSCGFAS